MELESCALLQLEPKDTQMMCDDWLCASMDCQISLYLPLPQDIFVALWFRKFLGHI